MFPSHDLTYKTIDADLNTITNIENADIKAAAAIDATKIADGSVTNTEFQYLGSVTSDIQTQLNAKANTALSNLASTAVNTDILPAADLTHDLGSASLRFDAVFTEEINGGTGDITLNPSATGRSLIQGQAVQLSDGASSDPTGSTKDIYYNTTSNKYRFYNGTSWQDLGSGGGDGDPVAAGYYSSTANDGYSNSINFDTALYDTHNAVTHDPSGS